MAVKNEYVSYWSEIKEVIQHTAIEYTFRMAYDGPVEPGQFFQVSIPKFGEAPISVSDIGAGTVDLTIRRVGRVTNEIFERYAGDKLFMRGPYGKGFEPSLYDDKELVIVAGGTGVSPVRPVIEHFHQHPNQARKVVLIAGFKAKEDILFASDFPRWQETMEVILTVDHNEGHPDLKQGLVTQYIPELVVEDVAQATAIVVGPPAMMRFSIQALLKRGFAEENIWVSYERKMCCGIGKCGHCKIDDVYVCLDGPVFNYTQAKELAD